MSTSTASNISEAANTSDQKKTAYHHGNLRLALIEVGLAELEEKGVSALMLRGLARRLGVSQTAPYHHFADKNALLAALAAEGFRRSAEGLRSASIKHHSLERRIRGLCGGYVRFARETPELFRLMYGSLVQDKNNYPELVEAATDAFNALAEHVQEMMADFNIRHANPRLATVALLSLNHGLAHLIIDRRVSPVLTESIDDDRAVIEEAARIFASGFQS